MPYNNDNILGRFMNETEVQYPQQVLNFYDGVIVNVLGCGMETQSEFQTVSSGVHYEVWIFSKRKKYLVPSTQSYEVLRQCYGTDGNICGRLVRIEVRGEADEAIENGTVHFLNAANSYKYGDEDCTSSPLSMGACQGITSDSTGRMNAFYPGEGFGEYWT